MLLKDIADVAALARDLRDGRPVELKDVKIKVGETEIQINGTIKLVPK